MQKIINKTHLNSDILLAEAAELTKAAFASTQMGTKYKLFNEAKDLKKIATIIYKYELQIQRGDY